MSILSRKQATFATLVLLPSCAIRLAHVMLLLRRGDNRQRRGDRIAGREKIMIKTYRIELKTNKTNKIAIGRTIYGVDFGEILKEFFRIAENEIGKERIAACHLEFYEI